MAIMPFSPYPAARNEDIAVGTTAVDVCDNREGLPNKRTVLSVRNTSPNATDDIRVNFQPTGVATSTKGILLKQYESFTDSSDSGYECWQGKTTAICATATGVLTVFEK